MNDLIFLSAVFMAEQIRKKKISPVEIVDAHLAQIERLNPKLNAFVQVDAKRARQAAQDAEVAVMHEETLGPLHGVPVSVKSSLAVEGMLCESGTRLRAGIRARSGCAAGGAFAGRGRDCAGCNQLSGASDGVGNGQPALWPHQQPMGPGTHARRFERRRSGGDCRRHVRRRGGQRRWWLNSRARSL